MLNDGDLRLGNIADSHGAALGALAGIFESRVIGSGANGRRAHAYGQPRLVHHLKHVAEALIGLAHEVAPAIISPTNHKVGNGCPFAAQLVVDARRNDVVGKQISDGFGAGGQPFGHALTWHHE